MSWDAYLTDDRGHCEGDWNYTHNCNGMANAAAVDAGYFQMMRERNLVRWRASGRDDVADECEADPEYRGSWWAALDGMSGPDGAAFLDRIIRGLEADPERFCAMNPANAWGDYESFVKVLTEMRNAVPEWPTTWGASG